MFNKKKIVFIIKKYKNKLLKNIKINYINSFYKLFLYFFIIKTIYINSFYKRFLFKNYYTYSNFLYKLLNNKKNSYKLLFIKNEYEYNKYYIKINNNFSEIFIKYNINRINSINLLNKFPKLHLIKKGDVLNINLFNNRNIKKLIWNISYKEKNIYDFINGDFREINVKKIDNFYFFILKIKLNKHFISNAILSGINKKDILSIIKIMSNYINFNKINYKDKCTILLDISKNYYIKKSLNKPIGIKFFVNGKNYYLLRKEDDNFYILNYLNNNLFIKFPIKGKYRISSKFNLNRLNPVTNQISPHRGIDIAVPIGTPVFSSEGGVVEITSFDKHGGKYIIIKHNNMYYTKYMHLDKILVNSGQIVNKGEWIGLSGNSGRSTGPHLHFELWLNNRAINPIFNNFSYLKNNKHFFNIKYIKNVIFNIL